MRRAAALTPDPADRARRLSYAAELAGESGQLDLAQQLLDEARRDLDDPVRAVATRAQILMLRDGDLDAARRLLRGAGGAGLMARVIAASYAQDPEEWAEVTAVVAGCDDEHVRLLHDVYLGAGPAARVRAAFDALPGDAPPGQVAALCRAATWLAAHDHFLAGQWDDAETAAGAGLDLCVRHDLELLAHDLRCGLGWIAAARGDADSAREYSRTVEQWAAPRGSAPHLSLSARNLEAAAMAHGDYETAYGHWTSISAPGVIEPHESYAPWAVLDLVESAVRTGRTAEARPGAAAGLTAQQLEVARLAVSGLSNKEIGEKLFLSSRTVSAHVYGIFPKLGITSRAALRDALDGAPPDVVI